MEALFLFLSWILTLAATLAIVTWDERRLTDAQLLRAWPPSSKYAAVFAFSPFCLLVHFIRTRRSWLGLVWGLVAFAIVFVLNWLLSLPFDAL